VIIGEKSWGLPDPYYALSVLPKAAQIRQKKPTKTSPSDEYIQE
jgi:hypothetical protein